jgi:hypothetical protein
MKLRAKSGAIFVAIWAVLAPDPTKPRKLNICARQYPQTTTNSGFPPEKG